MGARTSRNPAQSNPTRPGTTANSRNISKCKVPGAAPDLFEVMNLDVALTRNKSTHRTIRTFVNDTVDQAPHQLPDSLSPFRPRYCKACTAHAKSFNVAGRHRNALGPPGTCRTTTSSSRWCPAVACGNPGLRAKPVRAASRSSRSGSAPWPMARSPRFERAQPTQPVRTVRLGLTI